jgi:hypothetical protein
MHGGRPARPHAFEEIDDRRRASRAELRPAHASKPKVTYLDESPQLALTSSASLEQARPPLEMAYSAATRTPAAGDGHSANNWQSKGSSAVWPLGIPYGVCEHKAGFPELPPRVVDSAAAFRPPASQRAPRGRRALPSASSNERSLHRASLTPYVLSPTRTRAHLMTASLLLLLIFSQTAMP